MVDRTRCAAVAAAITLAWTGAGMGTAHASPWNRAEGDLFTITRNAWFAAEGGDADEGNERRFEQSSAELYAEYGATDRVMAGAKVIYAWQRTDDADGRDQLSGFAEAEGFAQVQLRTWEGGALAVIGTLAAPTKTTSQVRDGRAFERDARAGAAVLAGWDLGRGFATVRAGPDVSLGADAHTLRVEGTLGRRVGDRTVLLGEAYLTQSLGGADPGGTDFSVLRAGPSVVLPVWRTIRVQLGATFDVTGENVDLGASGFVAFWVGGL